MTHRCALSSLIHSKSCPQRPDPCGSSPIIWKGTRRRCYAAKVNTGENRYDNNESSLKACPVDSRCLAVDTERVVQLLSPRSFTCWSRCPGPSLSEGGAPLRPKYLQSVLVRSPSPIILIGPRSSRGRIRNSILLAEFDRWAEPLSGMISRTLSENLYFLAAHRQCGSISLAGFD